MSRAFLISAQPGSCMACRYQSCQCTCVGYRGWAGISPATGKKISAWSFKAVQGQSRVLLASIHVDDVNFIGVPCTKWLTRQKFHLILISDYSISVTVSAHRERIFLFLAGQLRETVIEPRDFRSKDPGSCTSKQSFGHLKKKWVDRLFPRT